METVLWLVLVAIVSITAINVAIALVKFIAKEILVLKNFYHNHHIKHRASH